MKVWVAKGGLDYEGSTILGVYDSKDKAYAETEKQEDSFDYTDVQDYEVQ